ncbi:carbohydrate ABC transporter permease [Bythopirellula polymerisocia]|uniref:Lactose transport system permease protein LacF n=1 Tax=Bythopirellula polymerisocia TaxID=2528003 RepID=A0A5C6CRD9_9BACT|nr:sugar ABC transporter permease [Bythopirellula polymerisocia]TWU26114.1 Lactose transport system permease protein LacF [Bythopirellula polymerisocia]
MNGNSSKSEMQAAYWMATPWLIGFTVLTVYPFLASLYWSFCRYDMLSAPKWVGLANYRRISTELFSGGTLAQAIFNTTYFAILSVSLSVVLGVLLAVMLSWEVRGRAVFRTICYLPSVVPIVAACVLWIVLLDPQQGMINEILLKLGIPAQGWFKSTSSAFWPPAWPEDHAGRIVGSKDGLVLMGVWGVGNLLVIYLAAIADIPPQLYEAAELDGAGRWRQFWHVTLPMLTPVIFFNVVVGLIHSVQAFTQIYIVSDGQGDPAGATLTLSLHLFLAAFKELDLGYASAVAWMLFVIILLITIWLFRTSHRWVHHQGGA